MIPEIIQVRQGKRAGGVLIALFHHSASLKGAIDRGMMPTLKVFNDFMQCGFDDIDERNTPCIQVNRMSDEVAVLEWKPFKLSPKEYEGFLRYLRKAGRRFKVVGYDTSSYKVWFDKCFS